MPSAVALVGCLDTKGEEVAFLKVRLDEEGTSALIVDAGVLGEPPFPGDVPRADVARAAGVTIEELRAQADRGRAIATMSAGAAAVVRKLYQGGQIQGVLAAGGSANTTIGCAAMRALPIGVPKVMVSTLASGDVSSFVGTKDILMLHSVVDVAGVNRISGRILTNAARAIAAMVRGRPWTPDRERPVVVATMFGVTTPCVTEARRILEAAGCEVLVFHATGAGGRAMEGLIEDGCVEGVLDLTTTELADELVGGIMSAGPRRLTVAGAKGIPQVVSIGAVDMVNFGPPETVPERFRSRKLYQHNPNVTLLRTTPEENAEIGRRIASRLSSARGPVKVFLPTRGVSSYAKEGGPFHDPEADARCVEAIRAHARPPVEVSAMETNINDPAFAGACARALLELLATRPKPR